MTLKWFNAREAADLGVALADQFAAAAATQPAPERSLEGKRKVQVSALDQLHERADREVRPLQFNFYQKARFANSFKWKLIENGIESGAADDVTQSLILHLSRATAGAPTDPGRDGRACRSGQWRRNPRHPGARRESLQGRQ